MSVIKVPATSANLGPGFDCMGLALSLYNTFTVEPSEKDILINVEERFNNRDNLFLKAYRKGCEALHVQDHIKVSFQCDIPVSRGLGSSAALIVGGIAAASALHNHELSTFEIFTLAAQMEGHPDNAAPAVYGGLNACMKENGRYIHVQLPLADSFSYTIFIPDHEVETKKAREILPVSYPRDVAAANAAHAVLMSHAFAAGDVNLLHEASHDQIHEPYRAGLIPHFKEAKEAVLARNSGAFLISGSGSTCLLISDTPLHEETKKEIEAYRDPAWQIIPAEVGQGVQFL